MIEITMFYIVFTFQVVIFSYYFPKKISKRMTYVMEHYPPELYPKLYPKPLHFYEKKLFRFKLFQLFNLSLGLGVLVLHYIYSFENLQLIPFVYNLFQFIPVLLLELSEYNQFKIMRETNEMRKRSAIIKPRKLMDYISLKLLSLTASIFVLSILFDFYIHDFIIDINHDSLQRTLILTGGHFIFAFIIYIRLYGKKVNPYQANSDRDREIGASMKPLIYTCIMMSLYFAIIAAGDSYNLDAYEAILLSLYLQVIGFFSLGYTIDSTKVENIDFNVYKENSTT